MAKTVTGHNLIGAVDLFVISCSEVLFEHHFIGLYEEAIDRRIYVGRGYANLHKLVISPTGVAYPGDATPGTGPKKVTIIFNAAITTIVHTLVDNVDFSTGWLILTKGNHLVVYNDTIVGTVTVEPS